MLKYSVHFLSRIPFVGYEVCRMDVLLYQHKRMRHLFSFHFQLRDDGACTLKHEVPVGMDGFYQNIPMLLAGIRACVDALGVKAVAI